LGKKGESHSSGSYTRGKRGRERTDALNKEKAKLLVRKGARGRKVLKLLHRENGGRTTTLWWRSISTHRAREKSPRAL